MSKAKAFTFGIKCKSNFFRPNLVLDDDPHRKSSCESPGPGQYNDQSTCSIRSVSPRGVTIGKAKQSRNASITSITVPGAGTYEAGRAKDALLTTRISKAFAKADLHTA
jgi:hypothetical protein